MLSETVELRGHIIDSLILPKILDEILKNEGQFRIDEIRIGQKRADQSFARIEVSAESADKLEDILLRLRQHGAEMAEKSDVQTAAAPADGIFPQDFYATTNKQTFVRVGAKEIEARPAMMDCGIAIEGESSARAVRFFDVKHGMQIVVGHRGVRVAPLQRVTSHTDPLQFLSQDGMMETPKSTVIKGIATELKRNKERQGKSLVVAGPVAVHSGAGEHLEKLIEAGYVQVLFAGNALAVGDIEQALYGTSLGQDVSRHSLADVGLENQLRAVNTIRAAGSIQRAVEHKILERGLMHSCVKHGVEVVLAGSIRDSGTLPEVITDVIEAQKVMREKIAGVTVALMMGTMLHSMAVESLLPATVRTFCIDINPMAISTLTEPGSFRSIGLVTDIEPFLRELTGCLEVRPPGLVPV